MMKYLSDAELLIADDHDGSFSIIYNRYWEQLYKKAFARLGNDADAQDIVQEVFISLWRNRLTIDASDSLSNYLFGALKFSIIKKVYRKAKQGMIVPLSVNNLEQTVMQEDNIQLRELQSIVSKELNSLPVKMRKIYNLSKVEHLRPAEIAEHLHISEQTVKNTLSTAVKRLRQKLAHYTNTFILLFLLIFYQL